MSIYILRKIIGEIMAIQDSFNITKATTSQSYAYKCWYNYNYGGNTMKISATDMSEITQTWNSQLSNWKTSAEKDVNKYEISDDDFSGAINSGKSLGKEKTGYSGGKGGIITRGVTDGIFGAAGVLGMYTAAGSTVANAIGTGISHKLIENTANKIVGKAAKKAAADAITNSATKAAAESAAKNVIANGGTKAAAKKAADKVVKDAAQKAAEKTGKDEAAKKASDKVGSWSVAAPLALAVATAYQAKKPNKEQKEACDELQNQMTDAQASLTMAQSDMDTYRDEVEEMSDEAQAYNEDANGEIEDKKTEFDMYKTSYEALIAKLNSGEKLNEDEKSLLKELVPILQELGVGITTLADDTSEAVSGIYSDMETYQDGYDNAAATIGEVQGLTDYAESFDSATRTMCYVEGGSQALNAASGTKAAIEAGSAAAGSLGFNAWAWACVAMGTAGAAMSGIGSAQQFKWAGEVGTEIGMREATQDFNAETLDNYDENIDIYQGQIDVVNDLELEIPKDIEPPENVPVFPAVDDGTTNGGTGGTSGYNGTPVIQASVTGTTAANNNADDDKNKNKKI